MRFSRAALLRLRRLPLREVAVAASAANLVFLHVWARILVLGEQLAEASLYRAAAAALLNVGIITVIFTVVLVYGARNPRGRLGRLAGWLPLVALVWGFNAVRQLAVPSLQVQELLADAPPIVSLGAAALLLAAIAAVLRWRAGVCRVGRFAVLVLAPLLPLIVGSVAVTAVNAMLHRPALSSRLAAQRPTVRVVWLVFDEMDEYAGFDARPATVRLPEFDRLRSESLVATNALPPSRVYTIVSVPSLVLGRLAEPAKLTATGDVAFTPKEAPEPLLLSQRRTIFSRARDAGIDTAIVGWHIAYCRTLGTQLGRCTSLSSAPDVASPGRSLPETMADQLMGAAGSAPLAARLVPSLHPQRQKRRAHIALYRTLLAAATDVVGDPDMGLVFVHLPVPHNPPIYNRFRGEFTSDFDGTYLDNMVVADQALGAVRRAMERAGTWENTTVLATADHGWRNGPYWSARVPFILKLAHRRTADVYTRTFNTVITHDLLLDVLAGRVRTSDDVMRALDRQLATNPSASAPASTRRN